VSREETSSYGIVSSSPWGERTDRVTGIVEKPKPEVAPSTLAVVGRYVLTPLVFDHLANLRPGAGGEIQLTDALARLISEEPVLAYRFEGTRYDCGSKIGYLQATVELALRHPEVGADFAAFLERRRTL
jgi:UTP--glucose-1-phosphate uridylyltransferase